MNSKACCSLTLLLVMNLHADADQTDSAKRAGFKGDDDGPASLCGGAQVSPCPHLHLPGAGLHTLRHFSHCQCGSREGTPAEGHHDHDGAVWHGLLVRRLSVRYRFGMVCFLNECASVWALVLSDRLSWGLLYAALMTAMSILMAIIATYTALFPNSDFFVIFSLIFLYGISSVSHLHRVWFCPVLIVPTVYIWIRAVFKSR